MEYTAHLQVGAAQINCLLGDMEHNLRLHLEYIAAAHDKHLDLIVFPELSLTGYGLGNRVIDVACSANDARLKQLAEAAGTMQVVVGFVEEVSPGECYNALAVLQHGRVLAVHRKINLPTFGGLEEGKWFTPAHEVTHCSVIDGWSASYLICADLWNPGLVHSALLDRPTVLCAPINSASGVVSDDFSNERNWGVNVSFYAMTYGTPVIMANRYGPEGNSHFWGGSRILDPRGHVLAQAEDQEVLITATLSYRQIARARFELPTHRDAHVLAPRLKPQ